MLHFLSKNLLNIEKKEDPEIDIILHSAKHISYNFIVDPLTFNSRYYSRNRPVYGHFGTTLYSISLFSSYPMHNIRTNIIYYMVLSTKNTTADFGFGASGIGRVRPVGNDADGHDYTLALDPGRLPGTFGAKLFNQRRYLCASSPAAVYCYHISVVVG